VRFLKEANSSQRRALIGASRLVHDGRAAILSTRFDDAVLCFDKARIAMEKAGNSPGAMSSFFAFANCRVQRSEPAPAISIYQTLIRSSETKGYKGLLAQALFAKANAELHLRNFSIALTDSQRSVDLSTEMGDMIGAANALYQLAEEYRYLNNPLKALDLHV